MKKISNIYQKIKWIFDLLIIITFFICAITVAKYFGVERVFNANFVCTNGDYQSYNAIRRFIDGQIPYKEYANYLGMGIIYLCAPLVSRHNTFSASLFTTYFMASFCFILFVATIFYVFTENKMVSALAGVLMPKVLTSDYLFQIFPTYGGIMDGYLTNLAYPGNSFRIGRLFLVILLSMIALTFVGVLKNKYSNGVLRYAVTTRLGLIIIGFIAGMGVTWSNDFGFCCIASTVLILIIITLVDYIGKKEKEFIFKRFLYFIPALVIGAMVSILIATRGDISRYIDFTYGVSQWQYTYYGRMKNEKILTLAQFLNNEASKQTLVNIVIYLISMIFCLIRLIKNKAGDRMIIFVFMFTSILAAQILYMLGSGPDGYTEGTNGFIIIAMFALPIALILKIAKYIKLRPVLWLLTLCVFVKYMNWTEVDNASIIQRYYDENIMQHPQYMVELEGVTRYADGLYAMKEKIGNDSVFSTYATALEDIMDTYQPTGSDYVIHALGDDKYSSYLENFKKGDYKWVQTTNTELWAWEIWTTRANWELYKEIYSDYTLESLNATWVLWEKAGEDANVIDADIQMEIVQNEDDTVKIVLNSEETRECFVDVEISWENEKIKNSDNIITFKRVVFVEDPEILNDSGSLQGYFLKENGNKKHIGMYMSEGYGEVILHALPEKSSVLSITSAKVNEVILAQRIIV